MHASPLRKYSRKKEIHQGRVVRKQSEESALYFLKKPPSWSIMEPLLPLWEGGGPP
jgi:hypothetical protein